MKNEEDIKKILIEMLKSSEKIFKSKAEASWLLKKGFSGGYHYQSELRKHKSEYKKYFDELLKIDFNLIQEFIESDDDLMRAICFVNSDIIFSELKGDK